MPDSGRYISICGPLASGKSTLAQKLTGATGMGLIAEDLERNPFMTLYYADTHRWGYHVVTTFLTNSAAAADNTRHLIAQHGAVQDWYHGEHFHVYGKMVRDLGILTEDEFVVCRELDRLLFQVHPSPTVIIRLDAETTTLVERVRERSRDLEASIEPEYIDRLRSYYPDLPTFGAHVIDVDTTSANFRDSSADVAALVRELDQFA